MLTIKPSSLYSQVWAHTCRCRTFSYMQMLFKVNHMRMEMFLLQIQTCGELEVPSFRLVQVPRHVSETQPRIRSPTLSSGMRFFLIMRAVTCSTPTWLECWGHKPSSSSCDPSSRPEGCGSNEGNPRGCGMARLPTWTGKSSPLTPGPCWSSPSLFVR